MSRQLDKAYSHHDVEARWYPHWVEHFKPSQPATRPFSMVIPPPNVTGSLHMGHALNNTLQDILCRYKRMDGHSVLWVPGTDHAGIATQNVVERQLAGEGTDRWRLGRENFIQRVWKWRSETGSTILNQLKALGVSCDWSRERFTMDEGLSRAVREAFVRLWREGLLYRAQRLINWCPRCKTALADIEVVHEEAGGHLWHVRYPFDDDPSEGLIVATTRPETMLGDTAVAVHPEDERYRRYVGRNLRLPIAGRLIPVIADAYVDPQFGTGALKITPGHDFNDFEIGQRHGLEVIGIFDDDARVRTSAFGDLGKRLERYLGKERFEARRMVLEELKETGALAKVEPYGLAVGHCYRCHTIVEPYLTPQWFIKIQPLAEPAIRAVREERIKIVPEGWSNSFFAWMENIKDWCISRQIWWGHQIPAWYCKTCEAAHIQSQGGGGAASEFVLDHEARPIVQFEAPKACDRCGGREFLQDPDVLDTWFSSALWPFSTLGWPEEGADLKTFYPTSVLVTGFDILFFWVARMMMMGLKFMGDVPFRHVYIHALVRDLEGQKMSKSKGNVIDPLDVMGRYGTDAFRFTLAALTAMGRDVKMAEERVSGYQNFVNKLWNASRFTLMNLGEGQGGASPEKTPGEGLNLADQWILSRLTDTIDQARQAIDSYRFNDFANQLYQFTWHEFCDWYLEMSKLSLAGKVGDNAEATRQVLVTVLNQVVLLLHPIMPFVTEEIWQALAGDRGTSTIMVQPYPRVVEHWRRPGVEADVAFLTDVIRAIRNLRSEINVPPQREVEVVFYDGDRESPRRQQRMDFLKAQEPYILALARVGSVAYAAESTARPKAAATAVVGSTEIFLPVSESMNLVEEETRLGKEMGKVEVELARTKKKLDNKEFLGKAKAEIIDKEKKKAEEYRDKLRTLGLSLKRIQELRGRGSS